MRNFNETLEWLQNRGKTVKIGKDVTIIINGYSPDAEAYDEYGRLVAIIVDTTQDSNYERIAALELYASRDNRVMFLLIEAPPMRVSSGNLTFDKTYKWFRFKDIPAPSGGKRTNHE